MKSIYYILNKNRLSVWAMVIIACGGLFSCSDYLDVVPEGTARLDNAFSMRDPALRYLYTCYSYLPNDVEGSSFEILGVDELFVDITSQYLTNTFIPTDEGIRIAYGLQSASSVLFNRWAHYYRAIHDCNVFLYGMDTYEIPDLPDWERTRWIAEAKVLKAYYHFCLLRQYGPVPVVRENLPVSAGMDEVKVTRNTVDEVVEYIVELIDEAAPGLPKSITNVAGELGRITRAIALSIKAQSLVTAASPLYNCNAELATLKNHDGTQLFPQDESERLTKWEHAREACDTAVAFCMGELGMQLYKFPGDAKYHLSPQTIQELTLRQAFCERWSDEVIWADTHGWVSRPQNNVMTRLNPAYSEANPGMRNLYRAPLKIAEMFYSDKGVPINEDNIWNYGSRYDLRTATAAENRHIHEGGETARLNFDREPRFYAWLCFDQGVWYEYGDDTPGNLFYYLGKKGQRNQGGWMAGYVPKKYVHYQSQQTGALDFSLNYYLWPRMRLAELLLYYAEALNEASNTQEAREEAMAYVDMIRARAGLETIKYSWDTYTNTPKYNTQDGLRKIIQQERLIELCFEGSRFWDLRRWKTATEVCNAPIQGWNHNSTNAGNYYRPVTLFEQRFGLKDYFFPIAEDELTRNTNLVQNVGW